MAFGARPFGTRTFGDATTSPDDTLRLLVPDVLSIIDEMQYVRGITAGDDALTLLDELDAYLFQIALPSISFPQRPGFYPSEETYPGEHLFPGEFVDLHMGEMTLIGDLPIVFTEGIPSEEEFGPLRLDQLSINFLAGIAATDVVSHKHIVKPYVDRYMEKVVELGNKIPLTPWHINGYLHWDWDPELPPTPTIGWTYVAEKRTGALMATAGQWGVSSDPELLTHPRPEHQVDRLGFKGQTSFSGANRYVLSGTTDINKVRDLWNVTNNNTDVLEEVTVAMWFKRTLRRDDMDEYLLWPTYGPTIYTRGDMIGFGWNGQVGNSVIRLWAPPTGIDLNQWHFVVVEVKQRGSLEDLTMSFFHNGIMVHELDYGQGHSQRVMEFFLNQISVGKGASATTGFLENFTGTIGPLSFWNRRLTEDEVMELYQAGIGTKEQEVGEIIRPLESRARHDHILMKSNPPATTSRLELELHTLEYPAGPLGGGRSVLMPNDEIYFQESADEGHTHRINRVGDSFVWDVANPIRTGYVGTVWNAGTAMGLARMDGWLGSSWVRLGMDQNYEVLSVFSEDDALVTAATIVPRMSGESTTLHTYVNSSNSVLALDGGNFVFARTADHTRQGKAPVMYLYEWDGYAGLEERTHISFGEDGARGSYHPFRARGEEVIDTTVEVSPISLHRVDENRLIAVWRDAEWNLNFPNDVPVYHSHARDSSPLYAQLIKFDLDAGTLTPLAPPVSVSGQVGGEWRFKWWQEAGVLIVTGITRGEQEGDYRLIGRSLGVHNDIITELETSVTLFDNPWNVSFGHALVGQNGHYAVVYGHPGITATHFRVGGTRRDRGAIQPIKTEVLQEPGHNDDYFYAYLDTGVQLSANENGQIVEYYNFSTDDFTRSYLVATKVDS